MKPPAPSALGRGLRRIKIWAALERELSREGRQAYLVGGTLRDLLLGRPDPGSWDLDLAVFGDPRGLAEALAKRLGARAFVLDERHGVWRVGSSSQPWQIDLAAIQGASIEEDLRRRDFTCNALALKLPAGGPLIDPCGGLSDLRARRLKAVSEKAFSEDPLRLVRGFRLAAQLGLRLDPGALRWVKAHRRRIRSCAPERVRAELMLLLSAPAAAPGLEALDQAGLLTEIFPELEPSRRCARVYYGAGGVLRHALTTVARVDFLFENLERIYPALAPRVREQLAGKGLLALGALLHDVAKPATARRAGGRLRFFGHDARGARMAARILERLRFSRNEQQALALWVRHHLRPGNLAANRLVSDKAVYRFFRDLAAQGVSLLALCWADHASYLSASALDAVLPFVAEDPHHFDPKRVRPASARKTLHHLQVVFFLLARYFQKPETARPKPMLDGHQVMKALQLEPGPRVGELLRRLQEAQAEGRVKNREQARAWLKRAR